MREEFETRIQGLEAEFQSLVTALRETRGQATNSQLQRRVDEGILARLPYEWRRAYEEIMELKTQMDLLVKLMKR